MNFIESVAWFLQNEGAEQLRIFEDTGLDFLFVDEKFDLNIDSLSRKASVTVTVFDSEQMDAEVVGENDVLSVVNELSKQSDNITYYYEQESREAYGRYSFNFSNLDELTFQLINACHGLIIAKETFLRLPPAVVLMLISTIVLLTVKRKRLLISTSKTISTSTSCMFTASAHPEIRAHRNVCAACCLTAR